jgi:asparagine synthase (glutamine-hydrolysing)
MCGFAGIVAWDDRYRFDRAVLSRMSDAIAHRGPDGRDLWINHENEVSSTRPQCGLAFARLAILDLDPRAMQPMTDGRRWLVFNGEIYNFRELRKEIDSIRPGYAWKTTGDSEVILRAYDCWGENCLEHLEGMFALAIWEPDARSVFLARDRMGQKPLYAAIAPEHQAVAFASELRALRGLSWFDREIDSHGLSQFLQTGYVSSPGTIYRGVVKVPPAMSVRYAGTPAPTARHYFLPDKPSGEMAEEISATEIRSSVLGAVKRQLISDVPVGCFLSGGIDSSIIAASMKAAAGADQRVLTFSIGFDDPRYDETPYARQVAAHLGTEHREFVVRPDAANDLPALAAVFGEPFGDSSALPTHYLARETRQYVKVALSGDGGDELFGGYDRYRAMQLGRTGRKLPSFIRNALAALPGSHPKSSLTRLKRFARTLNLPDAQRYAAYVVLFDHQQLARLGAHADGPNVVEKLYQLYCNGRDPVETALAVDRITYLPDDLLTKLDRASMLHALEVRSPFMDHNLVLLAARLKTPQLLDGGPKRMLREAFADDLPGFVFRRKKMGFAVPIGDWLRTTLRSMLHDLVQSSDSFCSGNFNMAFVKQMIEEHQTGVVDHSQRLYALIMLELWWRTEKDCP